MVNGKKEMEKNVKVNNVTVKIVREKRVKPRNECAKNVNGKNGK